MATVAELKAELVAQQEKALELSVRALDAIDKINAQASFWISIIAIGIGVLALVGLGIIWVAMLRLATKVADDKIKSYLESEAAVNLVRKSIQGEVKSQIQDRTFVVVKPLGEDEEREPFPEAPKREGA